MPAVNSAAHERAIRLFCYAGKGRPLDPAPLTKKQTKVRTLKGRGLTHEEIAVELETSKRAIDMQVVEIEIKGWDV